MKPLVIAKAGQTFPDLMDAYGDFEDWIARGLGLAAGEIQVLDAVNMADLLEPDQIRGVVITGSHDNVTENAPWGLRLEAWIRQLVHARVPLLGICYGHQAMARAMGGSVDFHPKGPEIGTHEVALLPGCDQDPLFQGLPKRFKAHAFHSQSVIQLPPHACLLAQNRFEPHQAFRINACAWGVQFHPEADAAVTQGYIRHLDAAVRAQGREPETLARQVEETPHAAEVLRRFSRLACG